MGVWTRLRASRQPATGPAEALYASAVAAARASKLYAELGAPDTVEGRFELLTLHVILLIERLKADGKNGADLRQTLFDTYVSNLDGAMREMGVGDLAMGKRMRKLGEAFYGRAASYSGALDQLPNLDDLRTVLARTVFDGISVDPEPLAAYVAKAHAALAANASERLLAGDTAWAAP